MKHHTVLFCDNEMQYSPYNFSIRTISKADDPMDRTVCHISTVLDMGVIATDLYFSGRCELSLCVNFFYNFSGHGGP